MKSHTTVSRENAERPKHGHQRCIQRRQRGKIYINIENEDVLSLKSDVSPRVIQKRTEEYVQSQSLLGSQSILPHYGVRRSENATQWPPQAAAEEMPPQNAFRSPVNERAEGEQYQEEISMQYYGSPSRSAVRRREYSPTQQSAHAATTRLPPDDFRPPAQPPRAAGVVPAPKLFNIPHRPQGQYSPPHANSLPDRRCQVSCSQRITDYLPHKIR